MNSPTLAALLAELDFRPDSPGGYCAAHSSWIEAASGPGWLAVGDAALACDPLSSQGLFNALYSALMAATRPETSTGGRHRRLDGLPTHHRSGCRCLSRPPCGLVLLGIALAHPALLGQTARLGSSPGLICRRDHTTTWQKTPGPAMWSADTAQAGLRRGVQARKRRYRDQPRLSGSFLGSEDQWRCGRAWNCAVACSSIMLQRLQPLSRSAGALRPA